MTAAAAREARDVPTASVFYYVFLTITLQRELLLFSLFRR